MDASRRQNLLIVPCLVEIPDDKRSCYQIYVVSLIHQRRADCAELRPKFVVDCCVFGSELCVVGSQIYMFDSFSKGGSAVGAFDLSRHLLNVLNKDDTTVELREDMMIHMAPMCAPKKEVRAVPTAGGKILAFSTRIESIPYYSSTGDNSKVVDFELYDPQTDSWEEIPPIQLANLIEMAHSSFGISAYSFVDDVTFIVETDTSIQYRLTIGDHGSSSYWEVHCGLGGPIPLCGYSRAVVGGGHQLWLTPCLVIDREAVGDGKNQVVVCQFPMAAFIYDNAFSFSPRSQSIVFEDELSSCCFLLETAQHRLSGQHFFQMDEYYLDMVKYFEEKSALEAMVGEENRPWAPQLEYRLVSSTRFSLSPKHTLSSLPMLAKPPTIIHID